MDALTVILAGAFVLFSFACVGLFTLVMWWRNTRSERAEKERAERMRRMTLRDWRQHNRFRSTDGRRPKTPRPPGTDKAHRRPPERKNIP